MSAEDRAALPLPPELFEALIRVIRETVRAEMRAEFEGREAARVAKAREYDDTFLVGVSRGGTTAAQAAEIMRELYKVPETTTATSVPTSGQYLPLQDMDDPAETIGASQMAWDLGVSQPYIRARLKSGEIPSTRYGAAGIHRVKIADFQAFKARFLSRSCRSDYVVPETIAGVPV